MAAQAVGRRANGPATGASTGQRQHWTDEEERALLDGIDQVGGPHWSRILQLHGPGGSVGEALKNRTQVPLKDKARNIKLFILKAGTELPVHLQSVTGELNRRAPGHPAAGTGEDGDAGGANSGLEVQSAPRKRKSDHVQASRPRAPAPRFSAGPVARTAQMHAIPPVPAYSFNNGFAPVPYHSPYAPPSAGGSLAHGLPEESMSPMMPDGLEKESIGASAAEEAARLIAAMMQGQTQAQAADAQDNEADAIDPSLT